ncbi:hypothetical protein SAMN05216496_5599 [Pseudomonas sp. Z003-0.4C(8344-21)]|uniref:hypothetical protein n=1 Tax=Pseudomonas sp. Z003-0.4C(8344-21) TaxID=1855380 RepID=UPI00087ABCDD|nr:hypothetical protein [Pseudomonas sp. Z003-0.4C(8344-21)]SDT59864.1 hypothetical protein SAMN05216496_5599 [Pseudomonas sp. Z003-0.4C(8344-21)]
MDWMQFVSAMVSALAWPAAVVTVVCLLKNPILGLIPKIRSFKYGELHVDLTEELKAVQESLPDKPQLPPSDEKAPQPIPVALQLAAVSPRGAILHSWLQVEAAVENLTNEVGVAFPAKTSPFVKMRTLLDEQVIDPLMYTTFVQLSKVRNDAVHLSDREMGYEDATMMWGSCSWLIERLNAALPLTKDEG